MKNKKAKYGLVVFLSIELFILSGGLAKGAEELEKLALQYWYSATSFGGYYDARKVVIPGRLTPKSIDDLEKLINENPEIIRDLNGLITSGDKKKSEGAKLAISEISFITKIPQFDIDLLKSTALDVFYARPSKLNAHYVGSICDLSLEKDFRAKMEAVDIGDREFFQLALSKSEIRQKDFKSSLYPVLSEEATKEQIEARKLVYGTSYITEDTYRDWGRRAAALSPEQLSYALKLADKSDRLSSVNIFQVVGIYGRMNKISPQLADVIIKASRRHIGNQSALVREAVTRALQRAGNEEGKKILLSMLKDPDFHVRNGAYYGLKNMGVENPPKIKGPESPDKKLSSSITPDQKLEEATSQQPISTKNLDAKQNAIEAVSSRPESKPAVPLWVMILGGIGLLGLIATVVKRK